MEPILQNPHFTSLLRIWKFLTAYYEYIRFPQDISSLSLYELNDHIKNQNQSTFIFQLIRALVAKSTGYQKTSKNRQTPLFLAKNNKFGIFEELLETSAYELGRSQVNFSLGYKNEKQINIEKPFQNLNLEDKYRYLCLLISSICVSNQFRQDYMQKLRKQNYQVSQQTGNDRKENYLKFGVKLCPSYILGTDSEGKCYTYVSKIGDSILYFDLKTKHWSRVVGQDNVKLQIIEKLINKSASITVGELDILQGISNIWEKLGWNNEYSAFDKEKRIFDVGSLSFKKAELDSSSFKEAKFEKIRLKFHQLEDSYSRFVGDCFNFRWASKQRRLKFHQLIDQIHQIKDLNICIGQFFNETKHTIHRKLDNFQPYDYQLDSNDLQQKQFKSIFLRKNYLYSHPVISESYDSNKPTQSLYFYIKNLLADPESHEPYLYEYLMIFLLSMLGIIRELYPKMHQKRTKHLEKLVEENRKKQAEQQKLQAQQRKCKKSSKRQLKKFKQQYEDQSSSSQSQTETTIEQKNKIPSLHGQRLRQKIRINYNQKQSNSKSNKRQVSRKKLEKKGKGKKSKMKIESNSESDGDFLSSQIESDTEKDDKGLNLDSYQYVQDGQTQKFRRQLRSKNKN